MTRVEEMMAEYAFEMTNAQDPKDRIAYRKVVTEATTGNDPAAQSKLLDALYRDVTELSKSIDFGKIPMSKGNFLRVEKYDVTSQCIEKINALLANHADCEELTLTNQLYDMLMLHRADFEYGYKFDIQMLQTLYCTTVYALYELIDMCIVLYAEFLKNPNAKLEEVSVFGKRHSIAIQSAKSLTALNQDGYWMQMMKSLKDPKVAMVGESALFTEIDAAAAEASGLDGLKAMMPKLSMPKKLGIVAGSVILALFATKNLLRFFYNKAAKLQKYLANQEDFLSAAIAAEKNLNETPESAIRRQEKVLGVMRGISEFIRIKILKADAKTVKEVTEEVKEKYSKTALSADDDFSVM